MTTNTEPKSIEEAIDQGVALVNDGAKPPEPKADDDTGGTDDNSTVDSSGDDADAQDSAAGSDSGDPADTAGDDAGQDADGADSKDGDADSDDAEGDGDADADKDAAGDLAKDGKGAAKPKAKEPDHYNDPIPNALKPATKERIRFLANEARTFKEQATSASKERDELITAVVETGATPEQYAATLDYLALVNSKDTNKLKQAANFMIRELAALSRVGGFRIPGVTSYAGHKDLEDAVAAGTLKPELAEELAAQRAATAHQGKVGAAQAQAAEASRRYKEADQAARAEMNEIEAGYLKTDPLYKQKKPIILKMLNVMIQGDKKQGIPPLHPSKWSAAYKELYQTLPAGAVQAPAAARNPGSVVPKNQPLRTQQPAGAQKPEPKSIEEALNMGIELARGG